MKQTIKILSDLTKKDVERCSKKDVSPNPSNPASMES
jgi:hypothetical protein